MGRIEIQKSDHSFIRLQRNRYDASDFLIHDGRLACEIPIQPGVADQQRFPLLHHEVAHGRANPKALAANSTALELPSFLARHYDAARRSYGLQRKVEDQFTELPEPAISRQFPPGLQERFQMGALQ